VRAHPARRESISWRKAIHDAVTAAYPEAPFPSPPSETKFTVEVVFRMTPQDLARPAFDLDNFAKPVLDTLFTSQNVSRLLLVDDTRVFRLQLEKVQVKTPQEQGADITVTWHPSGTPDLSTS
jgi:Holliday junction resolvase RusA-like endonuclease